MADIKTLELEDKVLSFVRDKGMIAIKPYVDPKAPNAVGLENYGMVVFPGTQHMEPLIFTTIGNKRIYKNGLNENADSIKSIVNEKTRLNKIKKIRETVAYLEKLVNYNDLDIDAPNFWDLVKTFRPDNVEYHKTISLKLNNDDMPLFPEKDTAHLVLLHCILEGGFDSVAPDLETCKLKGKKWYLSIENDIQESISTDTRKINRSKGLLEELYNEKNHRLVYISKILVPEASKFKLTSSRDAIYNSIDAYLEGQKTQKDKLKAIDVFEATLSLDDEELMCRAVVTDCYMFRIFSTSKNGVYHKESNRFLGTNTSEVVETLLEPQNEDLYSMILDQLKSRYW